MRRVYFFLFSFIQLRTIGVGKKFIKLRAIGMGKKFIQLRTVGVGKNQSFPQSPSWFCHFVTSIFSQS
jgi:hypothetical protein